MLIDCDSCAVRNLACGDCVVTVLLGTPRHSAARSSPPGDRDVHASWEQEMGEEGVASAANVPVTRVELDGAEQAALAVLAGQGLVPPLRLIPRAEGDPDPGAAGRIQNGDPHAGGSPRAEAG